MEMLLGVTFRLGGLKRDIDFTTRCPRSGGHLGVGGASEWWGSNAEESTEGACEVGKEH